MTRAGRRQDKLKSRVEDAIEVGRAGRKSAHGGWISRGLGSRGLGKGKDRDQNLSTGKTEGMEQVRE